MSEQPVYFQLFFVLDRLNVRARITVDGQVRFISDTAHPAINRGQANEVEIMMVGVPSADSTP